MSAVADFRTCSKCGNDKLVTEFDQRFIHKPVKLACASCRGIPDESHKWQEAWTMRRDRERRWQDWQERMERRRREESRSWQEELQRREEESRRRQEE